MAPRPPKLSPSLGSIAYEIDLSEATRAHCAASSNSGHPTHGEPGRPPVAGTPSPGTLAADAPMSQPSGPG